MLYCLMSYLISMVAEGPRGVYVAVISPGPAFSICMFREVPARTIASPTSSRLTGRFVETGWFTTFLTGATTQPTIRSTVPMATTAVLSCFKRMMSALSQDWTGYGRTQDPGQGAFYRAGVRVQVLRAATAFLRPADPAPPRPSRSRT